MSSAVSIDFALHLNVCCMDLHGLCVVLFCCCLHGLCMEIAGVLQDLCMDFASFLHGACMECI